PVGHRLLVAQDPARAWIDAQRIARPLRDVAEVAQQHALDALLDGLVERGPGADRLDEVRDVQRGEPVVAARGKRVAARLGHRLLDDLVLEIVYGVAVLVEYQDRKSTRLNSSHVSISYAV